MLRDLYPNDIATLDRSTLEQTIRQCSQCIYLGKGIALARTLTRYKMFLHTHDLGFAGHVMMDGFWEIWVSQFFARVIKPGMRVIDVGANYGYYSLLFADAVTAAGIVLAIEPNPAAAELLRRSINLNGFSGWTRIIEAGLGSSENSSVQLFVPASEPKNAHITTNPLGPGTLHSVLVTTLDRVAEGLDRIDLVKIDAEGSEEAIFAGMTEVLRRHKPAIVLEFNSLRGTDPAGLLNGLLTIYGAVNVIGYDGYAAAIEPETLLRTRCGEDWMLYFGPPISAE